MIDFLIQYGLFLAKSLTIILGILVVVSGFFAIAHRGKPEDGTLEINHLNEKYEEIKHDLQSATLMKDQWKKWAKEQKNKLKSKEKDKKKADLPPTPRVFILRFDGDIRASQVKQLRETISAIIEIATDQDEVCVVLESAGGFVHGYGLAASQLERLKQRNIYLTVSIDKCAASGGYLMACIANKIIAAPFAIVGSIGVVAQVPNFNRLLNKHNVDVEVMTAGEYKRTLTVFGKNTQKARKKFQEELEQTHVLFKDFIVQHRPQVNIDEIATGEHWHAVSALALQLVDVIQTSDDFILDKMAHAQIFELSYKENPKLIDKISGSASLLFEKLLSKLKHISYKPVW